MKRYDPDGIVTFSQRDDGAYVKHEEVRASVERMLAVAESLSYLLGVNHIQPCKCATCVHNRKVDALIDGLKEMAK